jgi:hypothetical protein
MAEQRHLNPVKAAAPLMREPFLRQDIIQFKILSCGIRPAG